VVWRSDVWNPLGESFGALPQTSASHQAPASPF